MYSDESIATELYDRTTKFQAYQRIESLQDYVLVAQNRARIERYSRGPDGTWILAQADGLASEIALPSAGVTLSLAEVYEGVVV